MTKDVLLSISGLQFAAQDEEDVEPVEVITAGDYYKKNGKHYILSLSSRTILWILRKRAFLTYIWCLRRIRKTYLITTPLLEAF